MGDRYECDINSAPSSETVPGFESSDVARCGISFPQPEYPGLRNFSSCCTGPISTFDACFHFCDVEDADLFRDCAQNNVFMNVTGKGFITGCNKQSRSAASTAKGQWKLAVLMGFLGVLQYCV